MAVGARRRDEPGKATRLVVVIGFLSSTSHGEGGTIHSSSHRGTLGFDTRRLGELMSGGKHGHGVAVCVVFP